MHVTIIDFQNRPLLMAVHTPNRTTDTTSSKQQAKLVLLKWLTDKQGKDIKLPSINCLDTQQQLLQDKQLQKLCQHIGVSVTDKQSLIFIEQAQLNANNAEQNLILNTIEKLAEYQTGKRTKFELPLDISIGTEFQQKVWQALLDIEYGQTISYAKLAQTIGQPNAYRAVANANGKNPITIIIPCHRVIASDGGLGGYTGGIDKKSILLSHEAYLAN